MDVDVVSQGVIATAHLRRDEGYFDLAYDEWLRHRSKYRRIALPIAIALLSVGGVLVGIFGLQIASCCAVGIGVFDLIEVLTHKSRSLAMMKRAITNRDLTLRFGESAIEVEANGENAQVPYSHYGSVYPTPHGVFLVTGTKSSTFVPFKVLSPPGVVDRLLATLQEQIRSHPIADR